MDTRCAFFAVFYKIDKVLLVLCLIDVFNVDSQYVSNGDETCSHTAPGSSVHFAHVVQIIHDNGHAASHSAQSVQNGRT
jgi:hypothetical protein